MPFYSRKYKQLRDAFDLYLDDEDAWGITQEWLFSIADFLYHAEAEIPEYWRFNHYSISCSANYSIFNHTQEIVELHVFEHVPIKDIILFGNILHRYSNILILAEEDY